jgi:hypothetical protein
MSSDVLAEHIFPFISELDIDLVRDQKVLTMLGIDETSISIEINSDNSMRFLDAKNKALPALTTLCDLAAEKLELRACSNGLKIYAYLHPTVKPEGAL